MSEIQLNTTHADEAQSSAVLIETVMRWLVKVCPDTGCEAVWYNTPKS